MILGKRIRGHSTGDGNFAFPVPGLMISKKRDISYRYPLPRDDSPVMKFTVSLIVASALTMASSRSEVIYAQNFDEAALRDPVTESDPSPGVPDWNTPQGSGLGWTRGEDNAVGGSTEWLGWSFASTGFWIEVSEDQGRSGVFTASRENIIAVADSDEAEDGGLTPEDGYNAFLRTPAIDLSGCDLSSLQLSFDSSFRQEEDESATVRFLLDDRAPVIFEIPDQAVNLTPVIIRYRDLAATPPSASQLIIEFAHEDADNNWWWAIDNLVITCTTKGEANRPPEVVRQAAGPSSAGTGTSYSFRFEADDPEGDAVQLTVDWADGDTSTSPFGPPGREIILEHDWKQPGTYPVRARAVDEHGAVSDWVELQTTSVTGEPVITLLTPPYLQNVDTDRIVIMTESSEAVDLVVAYGRENGLNRSLPMTRGPSGGGTFFHRVLLPGLEAGTHYHYQVRSTGGTPYSEVAHFDTAPDGEVDFKFSVWSDSQGQNRGAWSADPLEPTISMMKHMVQSGVAFGLTAGDLAENGNSYGDTRRFYLDRVATHLGTSVPWFAAWGNHDTSNPSAPLRLASDMPSRFRPGYSPGHGSFAFTYSNCFFVCIDHIYSNSDIANGWLEAQLSSPAARNARFRFLTIHVPPFCERWIDGSSSLRSGLVPLLEQYDVNFCFSGHTHEYERGELNHVHYLVSGGGSWLDHTEVVVRDWEHMVVGGAHDVPGSWAEESSPGVLGEPRPIVGGLFNQYALLTIRGDYLQMECLGFNADGSEIGVLDRMELGSDPGPDRDGDNLPDQWEQANGLDPSDPGGVNGATGDPDRDGEGNLEELLAGTNPRDPSSALHITNIVPVPTGTRVTWSSVPGKRYALQISTDLSNWTRVLDGRGQPIVVQAAAGTVTSFRVPNPGGRAFLRIVVTR